jgi:hypothetical protein
VPVVNGYCTVEEVRGQLGDTGSKMDTALLERAVSAASRAVDAYCGRRFWQGPAPVARLFNPVDVYNAIVGDISTKTGLVVQTDNMGDASYTTTLGLKDFRLEPLNADADNLAFCWTRIVSQRPWLQSYTGPLRPPYLKVTARWGWSAVPDEVAEATILKATSLFMRKDAPFGVAGFAEFGAVRITKRDPDVVDLLSPYQLAGFA